MLLLLLLFYLIDWKWGKREGRGNFGQRREKRLFQLKLYTSFTY